MQKLQHRMLSAINGRILPPVLAGVNIASFVQFGINHRYRLCYILNVPKVGCCLADVASVAEVGEIHGVSLPFLVAPRNIVNDYRSDSSQQ